MLTHPRNFTAYQFRFKNPGDPNIGRGNMWHSFDFGRSRQMIYNLDD